MRIIFICRIERVDPPRRGPAKQGEEIRAQYAISNALGRKVITCRLVIVTRGGAQSKKVMCRVGGGEYFPALLDVISLFS